MKVEELSADSKLTIESVRYKIIISATPVDIPIQHRSVLQLSTPAYGSETQKIYARSYSTRKEGEVLFYEMHLLPDERKSPFKGVLYS